MKTAARLVGAVMAVMPLAAEAQIAPPSGRAPPPVPGVAQACVGCHGPGGAGVPARGVPRIAALPRYYSARQLASYANGTRRNPVMEAAAKSLSRRDVDMVTAYFAQIDAPEVPGAGFTTSPGAVDRGRLLATAGSRELGVQACDNCHGPDGRGMPPNIPYLAGQGASYLIATLEAWREGTRRNDAGQQMAVIAKALTPEAIGDVARYYSGLPAPPPVPLELVSAPVPTRRRVGAGESSVAAPATRADSATAVLDRLPAADLSAGDPVRGKAILASGVHGCAACHSIPGIRAANGVVGPALGGMARRGFIAGQLPNRPEVLVAFLLDPPALVPRTGMPATGLSREEALHVAAYLYALER